MNEDKRLRWVRIILPIVILLLGVGAFVALKKTGKPPKRQKQTKKGMLVEVMIASRSDRFAEIISQGTVLPRKEVEIAPQVSGRVVWVNPSLIIGGTIAAGKPVVRIDPVDYKLALERAKAAQVNAQKNLTETESNAKVARREWKILGGKQGREANPLTLFKPQLKLAQANMRSAEAEIEQARVNLSRTVIRAPFNMRVRRESVERGQYVMVGRALATAFGTDVAEVIVPLPIAEVQWIDLPKPTQRAARKAGASAASPSPVRLLMPLGDKTYERPGELVRTVGEIDAEGRMTKIVVRIDDPYNLRAKADAPYRPDFEVGAFVQVRIRGKKLPGVVPIPAMALRLGSVVWVADKDDRLRIRKVEVARQSPEEVLISQGLKDKDRIILTSINSVVDGMRLRIKNTKHAAQSMLRAER